ncbi:hypothetical protein LCGC14_1490590 [marine sediment metagenome]|uniref:Uncharacterized protein n=1 Tax=marine sediment metagenome TaxID=412755 RepID=A0A0F9J6V3_9ZZZZ
MTLFFGAAVIFVITAIVLSIIAWHGAIASENNHNKKENYAIYACSAVILALICNLIALL